MNLNATQADIKGSCVITRPPAAALSMPRLTDKGGGSLLESLFALSAELVDETSLGGCWLSKFLAE